MFSKSEIAIPIPLNVWQDPQGNVVLHHSREECEVFFGCWKETGEPADYLCKLTFRGATAVRGLCLDDLPYQIKEHRRSCIYEVKNSIWLEQVKEQWLNRYPESNWDTAKDRHFFISGHDNYYDILATDFEEQKIPEDEAGELAKLIREA
jgi:hypothetical protein